MPGFPSRPTRGAFGPTFEDAKPIKNPKRQVGATQMNLIAWQLAGLGIAAPRAALQCTVSGGVVTVVRQMLGWDPKGEQSLLTPTYLGVGDYLFNFSTHYPDETGANVPIDLIGGLPILDTEYHLVAVAVRSSATQIRVRIRQATAAVDENSNFLLLVF